MDDWNRRAFLKASLIAMAGSMLPIKTLCAGVQSNKKYRSLAFYNLHTEEQLKIRYFQNSRYLPEALSRINHILRDHRTETVSEIDLNLLDLLYNIDQNISGTNMFSVISGYRTPETNEMLRELTGGVAKNSLHTVGQAIDVRLPGYSTARLRDLCVKLEAGGVGYYPNSDFVHIDTGRIRVW